MRLVILSLLLLGSASAPVSAQADTVPVLPTCSHSWTVRPSTIDLYCNGRVVLTDIHWDWWGEYATGHGVLVEKACAPKFSKPGALDCFSTKLQALLTTESRTRRCSNSRMYTRYVIYDDPRTFTDPRIISGPVQIFTTSC
jgi:hypothetical protein